MKFNNIAITVFISFSAFLFAQEEEISIDEKRNNEINQLLELVKTNKGINVAEDKKRLDIFINKVSERQAMLNEAKNKLNKEKSRNERLEKEFESNEKILSDLEESLQIKIGVLGELFGVTRQYAGELLADTENSVVFYEFPDREEILRDIGSTQVHDINQFEALWFAYFDEIVAGSESKLITAPIINPDGESFEGEITRYGLFTASYKNKFLKPSSELKAFQLLPKQPERQFTKNFKKYASASEYHDVSIDPTRGFLLSLYLDKPSWLQRISQGRFVGFIIILIGISGLIFGIYKIINIRKEANYINDSQQIEIDLNKIISNVSNIDAKENAIDEFIISYSARVEWGNNWLKFFAAVAPLLGLLGTVIGMIETFQAITLFGTGDPKQMAGGISQALITTMLGLLVAAPILGIYTYLSERTSSMIQVIEEKASYVLSKS